MKCYFCKTEVFVDRDERGEWLCPVCKTPNGDEDNILTGEQMDNLADEVGCPECDNEEEMIIVARDKIVADPQAGLWYIQCVSGCGYEVVLEETVRFEDGFYWRNFQIRG